MLRGADRERAFALSSPRDRCLEFESPSMWPGLPFGIWVTATSRRTGDTAQAEQGRNTHREALPHMVSLHPRG